MCRKALLVSHPLVFCSVPSLGIHVQNLEIHIQSFGIYIQSFGIYIPSHETKSRSRNEALFLRVYLPTYAHETFCAKKCKIIWQFQIKAVPLQPLLKTKLYRLHP